MQTRRNPSLRQALRRPDEFSFFRFSAVQSIFYGYSQIEERQPIGLAVLAYDHLAPPFPTPIGQLRVVDGMVAIILAAS
jgi:hypothetical protein